MAEVCRHCVTVFDHSDPVVDNTADDHQCFVDHTIASAGDIHTVDIFFLLFMFTFFVHNFCSPFFDDDFETYIFDFVAT